MKGVIGHVFQDPTLAHFFHPTLTDIQTKSNFDNISEHGPVALRLCNGQPDVELPFMGPPGAV